METSGWLKDEVRAATARQKAHPQSRTRCHGHVVVGMIPNLLELESMRPPPRDEYIERQMLGLLMLWWDSKPSITGPAFEFLQAEDFSCWGLPVIYSAFRTAWQRATSWDMLMESLTVYGLFTGRTGIKRLDVAELAVGCDGFWWDMKYYRKQLRGLRLRRAIIRMSSVLMSKAYNRQPGDKVCNDHVHDWMETARKGLERMDDLIGTCDPKSQANYWAGGKS